MADEHASASSLRSDESPRVLLHRVAVATADAGVAAERV
jgi:hypothetical protein